MIIIFFLSWVLLFSRYSCLPASQQSPEPFDNKDTVWHPQLPTSDTAKSTAVALLTSLPQPRKPTSVSLISLGSGFRIPTERPSTWHKPTGPKNTRRSSTGTTFAAAGPTRPNVPVALTFPKDTGTVKSSRTATLNSGRQTSQTLPFAVISTTVSDEPYALTFVPTQASAGTEVVESGSKLTTKTVPAGGWFWTIPKLPGGFPPAVPTPPPPPTLPDAESAGGSVGCVFGCSKSNTGQNSEPDDDGNPKRNSATKSTTAVSESKPSKSTSSSTSTQCSSKPIPICTEKVELFTSIMGSSTTVQTKSTTQCSTITACSGNPRTITTTTGTASSTLELCSPDCSSCVAFGPTPAVSAVASSKIVGRALREPVDGNINSFMAAECALAERVPLVRDHAHPSSAKERLLANRPINLALIGLHGCTSVIVVSKKGVWMSHFWEGNSFHLNDGSPNGVYPSPLFENEVLKSMDEGDGTFQMPGLRSHTGPLDWFPANAQPTALIITPRPRPIRTNPQAPIFAPPGTILYLREVEEIQRKLREIMPYITIRPTVDYQPDSDKVGNRFTAIGKVLFQYDPEQSPCVRIVQRAAFKIWVQDGAVPVLEDEWDALPNQLPPTFQKRDVCPSTQTQTTPGLKPSSLLSQHSPSPSPSIKSTSSLSATSNLASTSTNRPSKTNKPTNPTSAETAKKSSSSSSSPTAKNPNSQTSAQATRSTKKPPPAQKSPPPSPPPQSKGSCKVRVEEQLADTTIGDRPVGLNTTIFDAKGAAIANKYTYPDWGAGSPIQNSLPDTPLIVTAQLGPKTSSKPGAYSAEQSGVVEFKIGKHAWDSKSTDCTVSEWKRLLGILMPHRDMTCSFVC